MHTIYINENQSVTLDNSQHTVGHKTMEKIIADHVAQSDIPVFDYDESNGHYPLFSSAFHEHLIDVFAITFDDESPRNAFDYACVVFKDMGQSRDRLSRLYQEYLQFAAYLEYEREHPLAN